jgi:hypothetical protein
MDNRMTVSELIEHLKTLPQDYEIWSYDADYGCDAVQAPVIRESVLVIHTNCQVKILGDMAER